MSAEEKGQRFFILHCPQLATHLSRGVALLHRCAGGRDVLDHGRRLVADCSAAWQQGRRRQPPGRLRRSGGDCQDGLVHSPTCHVPTLPTCGWAFLVLLRLLQLQLSGM